MRPAPPAFLRFLAFAALAFATLLTAALSGCQSIWDRPWPQGGGHHQRPDAGPPAPADASPPGGCEPGVAARRFSLAVVPDTQYLYDQDRGDARVLAATLNWIVEHRESRNIAFVAQLGDLVENAGPDELADISQTFGILDRAAMPYGVLAGNHDLRQSNRNDDQRGAEPYLDHFGTARFTGKPGFGGASPTGYNRYHLFEGGGQKWLLLSLDWRPSDASLTWARKVLDDYPDVPAIITTHDLAFGGDSNAAGLSGNGQRIWNALIQDRSQVFLAIGGHYWPPARTTLKNAAGRDVFVQLTNYQDRYYGGSGMMRLYEFDLDAGTIEVETFAPWVLGRPASERWPLENAEARLIDLENRFVVPVDFAARFAGPPPPPPPPRPPSKVVTDSTLAYWRFDGPAGPPRGQGIAVKDLSDHGNDLERVILDGSSESDLVFTSDHHPLAPGHGSLFFNGAKTNPPKGAYLRTVPAAPLNGMRLEQGYTVEAFLRLPADCCGDRHAWMGVVSRMGSGRDAGKTGDDPDEPVATLTVAPSPGMQWAVYPVNRDAIATNWGHELATDHWVHVAVVNDGHQTVMYIDGARLLRNPRAENIGLSTTGEPWLIGATTYARVVEQSFYGWIGDVRISDRALPVDRFMNAAPRP
jgi:Concanavalin A-like lectin/glucanases superfamily